MDFRVLIGELYETYATQATKDAVDKQMACKDRNDVDQVVAWMTTGLLTDLLVRVKNLEERYGRENRL